MKYKIEIVTLLKKAYLAIRGYMSWRDISPNEHDEWERKYGFPNESLVEQSKSKSGSKEVYRLFCNSCRKDEHFDWVCGDDIACDTDSHSKSWSAFGQNAPCSGAELPSAHHVLKWNQYQVYRRTFILALRKSATQSAKIWAAVFASSRVFSAEKLMRTAVAALSGGRP